ncbi:MAG: hypothetical protein NZ888_05965 [Candidatus Nitrosocaldus sp.]|nr:hypothetical protein [Candidatus Nitrosocaldus sp.]MDW8000731.1 hypothetical protein [Candidatus Nitrosocaldus sp.]
MLTLGRRGKMVVVGAAVVMVAIFMAAWYRTVIEEGEIAREVRINVQGVSVKDVDFSSNTMTLTINFGITNNTDKIITVSKIDYEVSADGVPLGRNFLSYEDVALVGRPPVFTKQTTTLSSDFRFNYSSSIDDAWNRLIRGDVDGVEWNIKGTADIETAWSIIPITFDERI